MQHTRQGFTLIELSIVLVIIGLIIGGVLAGRDLIAGAAVRAQISQIEKYNAAVNTFYGKYGWLPGDIKDPYASNFGFAARGQYAGEGDGDGNIIGVYSNSPNSQGQSGDVGEAVMFWVDLSAAHLIDGSFSAASAYIPPVGGTVISSSLSQYLPQAKLGNGAYIYIWNAPLAAASPAWVPGGTNYFALSTVISLNNGQTFTAPSLTVSQAYAIDSKVDDGLPQSGTITALYLNTMCCATNPEWAIGGSLSNNHDAPASGGWPLYAPTTGATAGTSSTCYDNRSGSGPQQYSIEQNNGAGVNCALSFQMQGAGR